MVVELEVIWQEREIQHTTSTDTEVQLNIYKITQVLKLQFTSNW